MATRTLKKMLENLPVGMVDVVRLFLEAVEEGGLQQLTKQELIENYRKMVRMGTQAVLDAERTVPFREAVERSLLARAGRRKSTLYDLRSYAGRMVRHKEWAEKPLRGIGVDDCRRMLQEVFGHSPNAFRKGRAVLHSIFAYGVRQGWCERNPVDAIESPHIIEKPIEPLSEKQISRLLHACSAPDMQDMAPAVSLMLWCGIRPAEVRRLTWKDIDTREGVVYVAPQHSKTGGARLVPLRGEAARQCRCGKPLETPPSQRLAPLNWANRWRELRRRAGISQWQQDALRHTFASYHLRRFSNPPQLQAEMGHRDSTLLRTRYVNMRGISLEAARSFWSTREQKD